MKLRNTAKDTDCYLKKKKIVIWCFEPGQSQRITSGLRSRKRRRRRRTTTTTTSTKEKEKKKYFSCAESP